MSPHRISAIVSCASEEGVIVLGIGKVILSFLVLVIVGNRRIEGKGYLLLGMSGNHHFKGKSTLPIIKGPPSKEEVTLSLYLMLSISHKKECSQGNGC